MTVTSSARHIVEYSGLREETTQASMSMTAVESFMTMVSYDRRCGCADHNINNYLVVAITTACSVYGLVPKLR